ncbi:MAG: aminoacyl-tRNA hydrolase [Succinivibrio sp.]|nr:aminoacyl-tRNA hydrolase [Succinivibrio sp.]
MQVKPSLPKLIVGLGNPGAQYEHTRHNLGVDLLRLLSESMHLELKPEGRFFGMLGRGTLGGQEVRLLFPTTFMNESGRSVGAVCSFFKLKPEELLVLHDDLDLPPGQLKLKFGGGLAGHNGLKSIVSQLSNNQNFLRLRLGIGKPPSHDVISWVLGRPQAQDQEAIALALEHAKEGIAQLYTTTLPKATSFINGFKLEGA